MLKLRSACGCGHSARTLLRFMAVALAAIGGTANMSRGVQAQSSDADIALDAELTGDGAPSADAAFREETESPAKSDATATLVNESAPAAAKDVGTLSVGAALGNYVERQLVLQKHILRIDAGPSDFGLLNSGSINNGRGFRVGKTAIPGGDDARVDLGLGVGFGATDDLELGALFLPLAFAPSGRDSFQDMEFYGRYRLLKGETEFGVQVGARLPIASEELRMGVGLPVLARLGETLRLDTGMELEVELYDGDAGGTVVSLDAPAALNVMLMPHVFFGGRTGFYWRDFKTEGLSIPLGVQGGATLGGGMVDLLTWFHFPAFLRPDAAEGADTINLDLWEFGVGVTLFLGPLSS